MSILRRRSAPIKPHPLDDADLDLASLDTSKVPNTPDRVFGYLPEDAEWWACNNDDWHTFGEPEPEPLGLHEWLSIQASYYASLGSDAGSLVSDRLAELADEVRFLHAETASQYYDRLGAAMGRHL